MIDTKEITSQQKEDLINRIYKHAPETDIEAWDKYTKLNWVYQTVNVLDFQNIKWTPFYTKTSSWSLPSWSFNHDIHPTSTLAEWNSIFIEKSLQGSLHFVDIVIHKGNIVHEFYYDKDPGNQIRTTRSPKGELELRIKGLVTWHFSKFCGIITIGYVDDTILQINLSPNENALLSYDNDILKKIPTLYSRKKW